MVFATNFGKKSHRDDTFDTRIERIREPSTDTQNLGISGSDRIADSAGTRTDYRSMGSNC